jgi:hypothetical protein
VIAALQSTLSSTCHEAFPPRQWWSIDEFSSRLAFDVADVVKLADATVPVQFCITCGLR